mmetsp:Transcript_3768/g.9778  ORF Transcript_3768/g.9778 Transcript_3768/m.9778 type:complete len:607 (-) Transcript_3768:684-2504(-)
MPRPETTQPDSRSGGDCSSCGHGARAFGRSERGGWNWHVDTAIRPPGKLLQVVDDGRRAVVGVAHDVAFEAVAERDAADAVDQHDVVRVEHEVVDVATAAVDALAHHDGEAPHAALVEQRVPLRQLKRVLTAIGAEHAAEDGAPAHARRERDAPHRRVAGRRQQHVALDNLVDALRRDRAVRQHGGDAPLGGEAAATTHELVRQVVVGAPRRRGRGASRDRHADRRVLAQQRRLRWLERGEDHFSGLRLRLEDRLAPVRVEAEALQREVAEVGAALVAQELRQAAHVVRAPAGEVRVLGPQQHLILEVGQERLGAFVGRGRRRRAQLVDQVAQVGHRGGLARCVAGRDALAHLLRRAQPEELQLHLENIRLRCLLASRRREVRQLRAVKLDRNTQRRRAGPRAQQHVAGLVVVEPAEVDAHRILGTGWGTGWSADGRHLRHLGHLGHLLRGRAAAARVASLCHHVDPLSRPLAARDASEWARHGSIDRGAILGSAGERLFHPVASGRVLDAAREAGVARHGVGAVEQGGRGRDEQRNVRGDAAGAGSTLGRVGCVGGQGVGLRGSGRAVVQHGRRAQVGEQVDHERADGPRVGQVQELIGQGEQKL